METLFPFLSIPFYKMFLPYLWGMETWDCHRWSSLPFSFLPYLWGMETELGEGKKAIRLLWFLPYLWGMETWSAKPLVSLKSLFLPYLWGMETPQRRHPLQECSHVLTVPMRNGNLFASLCGTPSLSSFLPYLWGMETPSFFAFNENLLEFLPYLWGMETGLL